jgi:hypothetical protein
VERDAGALAVSATAASHTTPSVIADRKPRR